MGSRVRGRHFPGMPKYGGRLVGLGMKFRAQLEGVRSWPSREAAAVGGLYLFKQSAALLIGT